MPWKINFFIRSLFSMIIFTSFRNEVNSYLAFKSNLASATQQVYADLIIFISTVFLQPKLLIQKEFTNRIQIKYSTNREVACIELFYIFVLNLTQVKDLFSFGKMGD